jgi:hypothetical protein
VRRSYTLQPKEQFAAIRSLLRDVFTAPDLEGDILLNPHKFPLTAERYHVVTLHASGIGDPRLGLCLSQVVAHKPKREIAGV